MYATWIKENSVKQVIPKNSNSPYDVKYHFLYLNTSFKPFEKK